ncbi:MAG: UvrD-helicase domain-containing protein, partial [Hyphomicrobiaceae bacterium]
MPEPIRFIPPVITDDDIHWSCETLGLPANAFHGPDGNDPRQQVISSLDPLDIEACPGSGKTTLLVAKLAILARKWSDLRRGICVLSHTNVAREEIETCLGHSPEGQKLLSYPHYIGTIHSFINQFLSVPWLRSLGYPATTFDNELCEKHRRRLLQLNRFGVLRNWVENRERVPHTKVVQNWHLASPEFRVVKENGDSWFVNPNAPSAVQLSSLARLCAKDGYHRFEEVFMWAHDLLGKETEVAAAIRQRFPLLFIDEVQDNNEDQSALLHRLFIEGDGPVIRQRFGDSNQAIYGY